MRTLSLFLRVLLFAGLQTEIHAQSGTEKIWKDLTRLPQNLRDDLKKSPWWKNTAGGNTAQIRLDSTVKFTSFNGSKAFPLNKSRFEYPSSLVTVQSDFVNYGLWVLEKRTTITRNGQNRVVEVLEEELAGAGHGFVDLSAEFILQLVKRSFDLLRGAAMLIDVGDAFFEINPGLYCAQHLIAGTKDTFEELELLG